MRDKVLTITVVNPDVEHPCEAEITLNGATAAGGEVTTLTHSDIHAHNDFSAPDAVKPETKQVEFSGGMLRWVFAPRSVSALRLAVV